MLLLVCLYPVRILYQRQRLGQAKNTRRSASSAQMIVGQTSIFVNSKSDPWKRTSCAWPTKWFARRDADQSRAKQGTVRCDRTMQDSVKLATEQPLPSYQLCPYLLYQLFSRDARRSSAMYACRNHTQHKQRIFIYNKQLTIFQIVTWYTWLEPYKFSSTWMFSIFLD